MNCPFPVSSLWSSKRLTGWPAPKRILPGRMFINLSFELPVGLGGVLAVFPPETTYSIHCNKCAKAPGSGRERVQLRRQMGLSAASDVHDVDINVARVRTAFQGDADALARADLLDLIGQVGKAVNRLAVDLNDDVAQRARGKIDAPDAGTLCGTARRGTNDYHAFDAHAGRNRFTSGNDADSRRRHAAILDQLGHDAIDDIGRDLESDTGAGA